MSRVAVRKYWGPKLLNENLGSMPTEIGEYISGVREDCCGGQDVIKKFALLGRTVVTCGEKNEAMTKF